MMLPNLLKKQMVASSLQWYRLFTSNIYNANSSLYVMSFGDGSQGALGLPSSIVGIQGDAYEPTRVPNLPSDVSSVIAGHYHSLMVSSQGELWAWGRNNEGQLGRGFLSPRECWGEPKRVEQLANVRVKSAFASGVISGAIDDDGSLWVWGRSKRGQLGLGEKVIEAAAPMKVNALAGEKIVKVALGWGHVLALTEDKKLYGWGYCADGRLGQLGNGFSSALDSIPDMVRKSDRRESRADLLDLADRIVEQSMKNEDSMPIIWEPRLMEELVSVDVSDIACGLDHSLVLCGDGTLLSGGSNAYGQLGRCGGGGDLGLGLVDVPFHPLSICCGLGHSLAICKGGSPVCGDEGEHGEKVVVVSWGWNQSCQLGREGPENQPVVVESLGGESEMTSVGVSGGRVHSLAVTDKGELWVWGCGRNGRLGLGSSFDEPEPMPVDLGSCCKAVEAVAGFDHSLVLVSES